MVIGTIANAITITIIALVSLDFTLEGTIGIFRHFSSLQVDLFLVNVICPLDEHVWFLLIQR